MSENYKQVGPTLDEMARAAGADADSTPQERTLRKMANPAKYPNSGSLGHAPEDVEERLARRVTSRRERSVPKKKAIAAYNKAEKENTLMGS